mmetsp:Transcript_10499/g.17117  ORF Transcript_10499/g.17117 Transcript_10499/m.17117 type:complete len:151 (+) Transcript_10499:1639-2091(+)
MGAIESKVKDVESSLKDRGLHYMATQRELGIAVSISQTRDLLQWMGGVWCGLASIALVAGVKSRASNAAFPKQLLIPLGVLPLMGAYQWDMAYGTKIERVAKEAEHVLEHERHRFIPPKQAPFSTLYETNEKVQRVGMYWPSILRKYFES